jgi:hypothetical protein
MCNPNKPEIIAQKAANPITCTSKLRKLEKIHTRYAIMNVVVNFRKSNTV